MAVFKVKPMRKKDAPKPAPVIAAEPSAASPPAPAAAPSSDAAVDVQPVAGPSQPSAAAPVAAQPVAETPAVPEPTEKEQLEEMKRLRGVLALVERAQTANLDYSTVLGAALSTISHAKTRFNELATYTDALVEDLELDPSLDIEVPGMAEVILPWHPHFHGQDLISNSDADGRHTYLSLIRNHPWTLAERKALAAVVRDQAGLRLHQTARDRNWSYDEVIAEYAELGEAQGLGGFDYFTKQPDCIDWTKCPEHVDLGNRRPAECQARWLNHDHPRLQTKAMWKKAEREKLYEIAERHNATDWRSIATELATNRTPADCLRIWRQRPVDKIAWSKHEDALLREGVALFGENWQSVARYTGRHSNMCINRWTKTLRPYRRARWSPEEDANLIAAVAACGKVWSRVAQRVKDRSDAQCRERYTNKLDPDICEADWTPEEDAKILELAASENKAWGKICLLLPEVTPEGKKRPDQKVYRRWIELTKHELAKSRVKPGAKSRIRPLLTSYNRTRAKLYGGASASGRSGRPARNSDESDPEEDAASDADFNARYGIEPDEDASVQSEDGDGGRDRSTTNGRLDGDDDSTATQSPVASTSAPPAKKARARPPKRKPSPAPADDGDEDDDPPSKRARRDSTQAEPEIDEDLAPFWIAVPPPQTTRSGRVSKRAS